MLTRLSYDYYIFHNISFLSQCSFGDIINIYSDGRFSNITYTKFIMTFEILPSARYFISDYI